jgi:hypothetical protein
VYEVLAASHYTLLTTEEWDLATSENFNLNLPMEVCVCGRDPQCHAVGLLIQELQ